MYCIRTCTVPATCTCTALFLHFHLNPRQIRSTEKAYVAKKYQDLQRVKKSEKPQKIPSKNSKLKKSQVQGKNFIR